MKVLTLQKAHRRGFRGLWSQCQRVAGSLKPWKLPTWSLLTDSLVYTWLRC